MTHRAKKSPASGAAVNRRSFLQTSAAAGVGALALPYFVPRTSFGANDKIVTAHVGLGGMGRGNMGGFMGKGVQVAALCDVDSKHLAQAMKMAEEKGHAPDTTDDYRKLLERKDIDAFVVSTPDHWHAKITIDACEAGKDVYCEKPLTLTIAEGRKMVEAARKNKRIVQTGSQQRSGGNFRKACELVRSGYLGDLKQVFVGIPGPNHPGEPVADGNPPEELNYELWLGPAPERPYNKKRVHYNFRFFTDYSGGQMTNWGAHHIDIALWGMDADNLGPAEIEGEGTFHPQDWHEVTETCRVTHRFPSGVELIVGQKQKDIPGGTTFVGTKGKIHVDRGKLTSDPAEIVQTKLGDSDVKLYVSNDHRGNFLDCIKSRELPVCDVEIGHRSASVCHLGNIALQLGRKLKWDGEKEQFLGDDEANALVGRIARSPWGV